METVRILNAELLDLTFDEVVQRFDAGLMVTVNVDTLVKIQHQPEFAEICANAEWVVADGQFILYASRFLGTPIREKVSGSDFLGAFCQHHKDHPEVKVFLLGAGPGVADAARERINARVGREIVIGAHSPSFGFEKKPDECDQIIDRINTSGATVLAVGLGQPKQEKWIIKHRERMPAVTRYMGIGATIDFEAGHVKRAPTWMSNVGLEWFFRLAQEPRRLWRRYLVEGPEFFVLVAKQKAGVYRDPFDLKSKKRV